MTDTGKQKGQGIDGGMLQRQRALADKNGIPGYVCALLYVTSIDETVGY